MVFICPILTGLLLGVFGEVHPDTIWALGTQGSIAYFNGDAESARQAWTRLLAISRLAQGDVDEAGELLTGALPIANKTNHRMLGQIQAALADVYCRSGNPDAGVELSTQALASNQQEHGNENWRSHWAALVLAYCKTESGTSIEAESLQRSVCVIKEKWPVPNFFSLRASELHGLVLARQGRTASAQDACIADAT